VEATVTRSLVEIECNLAWVNVANGKAAANDSNLTDEQAKDFINELMNQVANELINKLSN
jgi:hypothetical protein